MTGASASRRHSAPTNCGTGNPGRFGWAQWLTHDSEAFPDRSERHAVAAHAERWFQSTAIAEWTWMSERGVPLADQQTLARMIGVAAMGPQPRRGL